MFDCVLGLRVKIPPPVEGLLLGYLPRAVKDMQSQSAKSYWNR